MKRAALVATARLFLGIALAGVLAGTLAAVPAAAQGQRPGNRTPNAEQPQTAPAPRPALRADLVAPYDGNAQETHRRLWELMQQYPPSLVEVLRLDPSLLTNPVYLEPYPALAEFLGQHPEIAHNPGFFVGEVRRNDFYNSTDPKLAVIRMMDETLAGVAFLIGFLTVVGTIAWLLRSVIEHRRWLRVSKTHTETHTKLLDRLTSNAELMAYMESPAGRRFLEAAPIPLSAGPRSLSAPIGRILWSVQAGCIIAFAGAGLMYSSTRFAASTSLADVELPLFVMGATAVAIGAGFTVSAMIAYGLSRRLGLLTSLRSPLSPESDTEASRLS